jgi:leucyl-tRNA---protein transferase
MQCPYLADQSEQLVFTHLKAEGSDPLHGVLAQAGFRRSHNILYRPDCPTCNACVPVRVSAADFAPSRSQRRVLAANGDAPGAVLEPTATAEQFDLFVHYQTSRHGDGSMSKMNFEDYQSMVEDSPIKTLVIEYRTPDGNLVACALSDKLSDGLSMVYSFFDPEAGRRGLGTFMILDHIRRATALKLDFVYLGYWIAEAPKMAYKTKFRPLETLGRNGWERLEPPSPAG